MHPPDVVWTKNGFRIVSDGALINARILWLYPSGQVYELLHSASGHWTAPLAGSAAWVLDAVYHPTSSIQGKNMKRTFFVVGPSAVLMSHTCEDISQDLLVERADARLTGKPLDVAALMAQFPSAAEAARQWGAMKGHLKGNPKDKGIYIMVTEDPPTESQMRAFAEANQPVKANV